MKDYHASMPTSRKKQQSIQKLFAWTAPQSTHGFGELKGALQTPVEEGFKNCKTLG
jgi:hypothetical protein